MDVTSRGGGAAGRRLHSPHRGGRFLKKALGLTNGRAAPQEMLAVGASAGRRGRDKGRRATERIYIRCRTGEKFSRQAGRQTVRRIPRGGTRLELCRRHGLPVAGVPLAVTRRSVRRMFVVELPVSVTDFLNPASRAPIMVMVRKKREHEDKHHGEGDLESGLGIFHAANIRRKSCNLVARRRTGFNKNA